MSSRIIVKNLPKHVTESRLRTRFGEKGTITDIKMIKTLDGRFRRFAFIGYKSESEAEAACKYFNDTFFDTSKMSVELAKGVGDAELDRPWSKYSAGSSAHLKLVGGPEKIKGKKKVVSERVKADFEKELELVDPKMAEFVQVMKPKVASGAKTWTNDELLPNAELIAQKKLMEAEESEEEEEEELPMQVPMPGEQDESLASATILDTGRLFLRNLSYDVKEEDLTECFSRFGPVTEVHLPIDKESKKSKGFAYILFMFPEHALKAYEELDGRSFHGRLLHILPGQEKPDTAKGKLFFEGEPGEGATSSFKKKKQEKQKANAQKDFNWNTLFMNTDAVVQAMSEKLKVKKSDILDTTDSSTNMAIRVAVAETHIINEVKSYLKENGVSLDFLDEIKEQSSEKQKSLQRSGTVIVIKNIPYETEELDIRNLFQKFGTLGRVLVPPSKTIAVVEFLEPTEARSAFKHLAYSRFKSLPLFLEWAPERLFSQSYTEFKELNKKKNTQNTSSDSATVTGEVAVDSLSTQSLYLKNLNFATTEESLLSALTKDLEIDASTIRSVKIARKKDIKSGKKLSLGYGFIEFADKESALKGYSKLTTNPLELDGHVLDVKLSNVAAVNSSGSSSSKIATSNSSSKSLQRLTLEKPPSATCTKLLVKNIPFESNEKEIRTLFKTFGHVKSVRLPRKMNGSHRGFGFVDFTSQEEALHCLKQLVHTHFYGRHLVLQWADDSDSINNNNNDNNENENENYNDNNEAMIEAKREKTKKRLLAMNSGSAATGSIRKKSKSIDEMVQQGAKDDDDEDDE